jgi:SAM-dependent methyltransferase
MRLDYEQLDTNTAKFPTGPFDLVVNHAALHHVAYLDRVARKLCEILSPDGVLVSWDYVGSHRNQYSGAQWEAAWKVNLDLPRRSGRTCATRTCPQFLLRTLRRQFTPR